MMTRNRTGNKATDSRSAQPETEAALKRGRLRGWVVETGGRRWYVVGAKTPRAAALNAFRQQAPDAAGLLTVVYPTSAEDLVETDFNTWGLYTPELLKAAGFNVVLSDEAWRDGLPAPGDVETVQKRVARRNAARAAWERAAGE